MPSVSGSTLRNALICLILAAFPIVHPLSGSILGETIWWLVLGFVFVYAMPLKHGYCLLYVQILNIAIYTRSKCIKGLFKNL